MMQHLFRSGVLLEQLLIFSGLRILFSYTSCGRSRQWVLGVSIATLSTREWESSHYCPLPAGGETADGSLPTSLGQKLLCFTVVRVCDIRFLKQNKQTKTVRNDPVSFSIEISK